MLAIARGLAAQPEVLLLDEPLLGLAPAIVKDVFSALAKLRAQGMTLLLVDQLASMALSLADRAYVLSAGEVVHAGPSDPLLEPGVLARAYLGARADTVAAVRSFPERRLRPSGPPPTISPASNERPR
jgi:ABC-type branched-subunit amino acid transport system ATPase component